MTNAQLATPHETCSSDAPLEHELTAAQLMKLKTRRHVWCCPGCDHAIPFGTDQIEAVPFFIVRHVLRSHDIQPDRIIQAEPTLTDEVRAYCRQMGIRSENGAPR